MTTCLGANPRKTTYLKHPVSTFTNTSGLLNQSILDIALYAGNIETAFMTEIKFWK
jgi:hypothetical protein